MEILLIHQAFPAQFVHLAGALRARGDTLTVITLWKDNPGRIQQLSRYATTRYYRIKRANTPSLPVALRETETKLLRGQWVAKEAWMLRAEGYTPDLILAHPGWGEALFLRDIWPHTPQLHYMEFAYEAKTDVHFDPEFEEEETLAELERQRMKSANTLLNLQSMDWGYTPTRFQWSTVPPTYRDRIAVIHDGIDTERIKPDANSSFQLPDGRLLRRGDPLLTFVNRTFEPYRGVHRLMRALPKLQERHPDLQVLLIGKDSPAVSYGKKRSDGRGWLAVLRSELADQLDWSRIHTPGQVPYARFLQALQTSLVHVYFTYPFVLSWSMLEAMACEALVIGSATEPVQEVIRHGENGLLVGFHDTEALVEAISSVILDSRAFDPLRRNARKTILANYRIDHCLAQQLTLVDGLARGVLARR
jgi:glycosyltransferase involved in cell wall biosynthesis